MTDRDWTVAPGETLSEWMDENALAANAGTVAVMAHLRPGEVEGVLYRDREITPRIAAGLQRATDIPATFWLNVERTYRADLAAGRSAIMTETEVLRDEIRADEEDEATSDASESVWRIRLEMEGHDPGEPVYTTDEATARKAEAAGYAVARFVT